MITTYAIVLQTPSGRLLIREFALPPGRGANITRAADYAKDEAFAAGAEVVSITLTRAAGA